VGARYGVAKNPGPSAKKARPSAERLGAHQEEDEREVTGARADHERVPDLVIAEMPGRCGSPLVLRPECWWC
jgi:hypothetical protein